MSGIPQTFEEFGRSIGLGGLLPGTGGRLSLRIGPDRRLDFHVLDSTVLLLLVRPFQGAKLLVMRRALDACHRRHGWSLPVRAGLSREGHLVFITRVPAGQFRPHVVEQAIDLLNRLHDKADG
jgi:type III secretion system chaperone SycN